MALPESLALVYHVREPFPREVPLEHVYRDLQTPPALGRPYVILNMVQTLDGAVAIDGKAWAIGSPVEVKGEGGVRTIDDLFVKLARPA